MPRISQSTIFYFGIALFAVATFYEIYAILTGGWPTKYSWIVACIGAVLIAVPLRDRKFKVGRLAWIILGTLFLLILIFRFVRYSLY